MWANTFKLLLIEHNRNIGGFIFKSLEHSVGAHQWVTFVVKYVCTYLVSLVELQHNRRSYAIVKLCFA